MGEIISACVLLGLSAGTFFLSVRSFMQKGFLLNNVYLYASPKEREKMDKAPYYRQSALVLFLIGLIFLFNGLYAFLQFRWLLFAAGAAGCLVIVVAIVSSIVIEKNKTGL